MALSPQELKILQYAKDNGKSAIEAKAAIAKYRTSQPVATTTQTVTPAQDTRSFGQKILDTASGAANILGLGKATNTFGNALARTNVGASITGTDVNANRQYIEAPTASQLGGAALQTGITAASPLIPGGGSLATQVGIGALAGYGYDVGSNLLENKSGTNIVKPGMGTAVGAVAPVALRGASIAAGSAAQGVGRLSSLLSTKVGETASKVTTPITDTIENFGSRISAPDVSTATRVSLNPKEALKNTGQEINVTVGGKLKKLSELTPEETTQMQFSTQKALGTFTEQATKFKATRNPAYDPLEIVGKRVDSALNFVDKKRMGVGKMMGEIEQKYTDIPHPINENTLNHFAETLKNIDNPKFGVDTMDAPIVKKLVQDFDNLEANGATVGERLDFVRSWDKYLNDAKDGFGNFKENATVNTRIQSAVKKLKDETVNFISENDKTYRELRSKYSAYKKLDEIGNTLLGKYGALNDRVRGGATVKRAIKSNSDAGARQFLIQLKDITGYDALKDGDLALTAMENVGDFHGLSLLEILKEGKTGLVAKGLEKVQTKLVGDNAARVNKFVSKGINPKVKPNQPK